MWESQAFTDILHFLGKHFYHAEKEGKTIIPFRFPIFMAGLKMRRIRAQR